MSTPRGLILAAPSSGSGKTTLTLGLLRALRRAGVRVRGAKSGPDYIDPAFHEAASGAPSLNLDAWAMSETRLRTLGAGDGLLLIEGAMGLFDGAPPEGRGATADLARILGLPVVLVVDAARMSQSIAPLVAGFVRHDPDVRIAGIILNKVGSPRHERILRTALAPLGIPVLGAVLRNATLALPSRHLGLVQAREHADLEAFLDAAADQVSAQVNLTALQEMAQPYSATAAPTGQRAVFPRKVAVARDAAFTFVYPHQLAQWRHTGTKVAFFSPLADDPVPEADMVFLPGGYPELHAEPLTNARTFHDSLRAAARNTLIYGECGGYMVLGEALTDASGTAFKMAGLLGLHTSFATRKLHLGYRRLESRSAQLQGSYAAHEFHYATTLAAEGTPLFDAWDAEGTALPPMGLQNGRVMGSFAHIIDVI
ncbi:cobyrinate a,c-diamide synthase [Tropicimonas sp. S265A]|uniref:cobyrinate a,c-diamide synthase n=1 Tax=Tropicimonas sp. S265A TaxID=3415134 RepID=UPI003C7C9BAA